MGGKNNNMNENGEKRGKEDRAVFSIYGDIHTLHVTHTCNTQNHTTPEELCVYSE